MKMSIVALSIVFAIAMLVMSGCAGYRGYALIRENSTDSVTVKDNGIIKKKPIYGKGIDFWSNKPMIIKMTVGKDGNITYEYSSKKTSFWEKIFGGYKVLKPDNVGIGK